MSDAEVKLAAARTRLILDKPFLGALVLRLPLKPAAAWCRTMATDARAIYYQPKWIEALSSSEVQFALAHEALHCALGHFARRGHRVQRKWDMACDFAINPLLIDEGLKPPPGAQVLDLFRGLSAEEIYPCLDDNADSEMLDDHVWDSGEGGQGHAPDEPADAAGKGSHEGQRSVSDAHQGSADAASSAEQGNSGESGQDVQGRAPVPLSAKEKDQLQQQWHRYLAGAAQRAREAGKLSGSLARLSDGALSTQVSWSALLAQYLTSIGRDDYSWQRPSRRTGSSDGVAGAGGEALWPGLRSHSGDIHVAVDVSGSVSETDLAGFLGELNALKGAVPVRITLFACDDQLADDSPWVFEPWDPLRLPPALVGGGGTDFKPVFDWISRMGQRPDSLIYFTDAVGEFPSEAPAYPVLWLVKGNAPVPFGRRIQLNT